jgi:hypothetical protein
LPKNITIALILDLCGYLGDRMQMQQHKGMQKLSARSTLEIKACPPADHHIRALH